MLCTSKINTTSEQTLSVICQDNGNWVPNPAQFTCSPLIFTTTLPGIVNNGITIILCVHCTYRLDLRNTSPGNNLLTILAPSIISAIILISLPLVLTLCAILRIYVTKETSLEDHNQQPTYEEISDHKDNIPMEENAAYENITQAPVTEDS